MIQDETLIIDSGGANVASLLFAFERLGVPARLSNDPADLAAARRAVLPGVGAADDAVVAEADTLDDLAVAHIKAGDETTGEHLSQQANGRVSHRRTAAPAMLCR